MLSPATAPDTNIRTAAWTPGPQEAGLKLSQLLVPAGTVGDPDPLVAAGCALPLADGLHSLLPLGQRVLRRVEKVIHRELVRVGAQEVALPLLQPAALWQTAPDRQESRADQFGDSLFRLRDRHGTAMALAPTHEEVAHLIAGACVRGPGDLPRLVYQIRPRFRDGPCGPGLLRTREFGMADAYSFHLDDADLSRTYGMVRDALVAAVRACGASAQVVAAHAGAMGGAASEELVAPLSTGAIAALCCEGCGYAASLEVATARRAAARSQRSPPLVELPAAGGAPADRRVACVPLVTGGRIVLAVHLADTELNPVKIADAVARVGLPRAALHTASAEELRGLGATREWITLGSTHPDVLVVADEDVGRGRDLVAASPRPGHVLTGLTPSRDARLDIVADILVPAEGASCVRCDHPLEALRGIEVGHVFSLDNRYAEAAGAFVNGRPVRSGCYGLGTTRLLAVLAEQRRGERGVVWPVAVAPYLATVAPVHSTSIGAASRTASALEADGLDVLLDDVTQPAGEAPGIGDRLGLPYQVLVEDDRVLEVQERASGRRHRSGMQEAAALLTAVSAPEHG